MKSTFLDFRRPQLPQRGMFVIVVVVFFTAEGTPITTASHEVYFVGLPEAPITTARHDVYFFGLPEAPITTASHVCICLCVFLCLFVVLLFLS